MSHDNAKGGSLSLSQYAHIQVLLEGKDGGGGVLQDVLEEVGVGRVDWEKGKRFKKKLEGDPWSEMSQKYGRLYRKAYLSVYGPAPRQIPLEEYVDMSVSFQLGDPVEKVLAAQELTWDAFTHLGHEWMSRMDEDKRLQVYFNLKVQKRYAERTGKPLVQDYVLYVPGNLIRSFTCENCGARKVRKPTHSYVYCDYCASLIGYDGSVSYVDPTSLDEMSAGDQLLLVLGDDLTTARKNGDKEAYAEIRTFMAQVLTEVCPRSYPPRIGDPDYREKYIADWSVPLTVATMFDEGYLSLNRKVRAQTEKFHERPSYGKALKLFHLSMEQVEYELELYMREGLLEQSPDPVTPDFYRRFNRQINAHQLLPFLSSKEQKSLIEAAQLDWEYQEVPKIEIRELGCGQCGHKAKIPQGAKSSLCIHCGHLLDLVHHQFPCSQCGADIVLPKGKTEAICAYCNARWTSS